jgi:hypothetical protein
MVKWSGLDLTAFEVFLFFFFHIWNGPLLAPDVKDAANEREPEYTPSLPYPLSFATNSLYIHKSHVQSRGQTIMMDRLSSLISTTFTLPIQSFNHPFT